jgi:N-acetylglucosamine-6-phosphate deacetylase
MSTVFQRATVYTPLEVLEGAAVVVSDEGRITYVGPMERAPSTEGRQIDLGGRILAPGFMDIHVHGGNGITFDVEGDIPGFLEAYSEWIATAGVTGHLCSIAAPNAEALEQGIRHYVHALEAGPRGGAETLGLHLEGPFLSREKKGAFNPAWLRSLSMEEAEAYLQAGEGWIRQMTLAPELPEAADVARRFRQAGVVVALGHTNTDYEAASTALRGDWTHVTHTFNAQRGFEHRAPGVFGAVLTSDKVTAELIADTIHVHPGAMKVVVRCLGVDRIVLITDAMAGAGLQDGEYDLVGHRVTVRSGRATLSDGTLAGSTAKLNQCVRNMHQQVGLPLAQAVQMATLNPAQAMGFADRLGSIAVGKDASLTVIDENVAVYLTMVKGTVVYEDL